MFKNNAKRFIEESYDNVEVNPWEVEYMEEWKSYITEEGLQSWREFLIKD